jgi:hypothetical protein
VSRRHCGRRRRRRKGESRSRRKSEPIQNSEIKDIYIFAADLLWPCLRSTSLFFNRRKLNSCEIYRLPDQNTTVYNTRISILSCYRYPFALFN